MADKFYYFTWVFWLNLPKHLLIIIILLNYLFLDSVTSENHHWKSVCFWIMYVFWEFSLFSLSFIRPYGRGACINSECCLKMTTLPLRPNVSTVLLFISTTVKLSVQNKQGSPENHHYTLKTSVMFSFNLRCWIIKYHF